VDVETLRSVDLFAGLDDAQLDWVVRAGERRLLADGAVLFRDGAPADAFYVLVEGELVLSTTDQGGQERLLTRHVRRRAPATGHEIGRAESEHDGKPAGAHGFTGELPLLADADYMATAVAVGPTEVVRFSKPRFFEMLARCPQVCTVLLPVLAWRIHASEAAARRRATLEALGTLAAGLAHELNNPVAAVSRSAAELVDLLPRLIADITCLGQVADPAELRAVTVRAEAVSGRDADPLDVLTAADDVTDWLEDHDIDSVFPDDLVELGVRVDELAELAAVLRPEVVRPAVEVLAGALRANATAAAIVGASERISALVASTRTYSDLDRAAERDEVDVVNGVEATLAMLAPKLASVRVVRDYQPGLPSISARPSELNQVWTNLIDNAADAMAGRGELRITAQAVGEDVLVEFRDSGHGIPADALARLFQPFFTTKDVGRGTGLGLYLSHEIVERRHGGGISVSSEPGDTRFCVRLPVRGGRPGRR
jgi:signal transduction histidine kinase